MNFLDKVFFKLIEFLPLKKVFVKFHASTRNLKLMKSVLSICSLFGVHNPIGSNIAVRKIAFEKAGGFDTSLVTAEDLELVGRMNKQGKIKFSSKVSLDVSARRVKKWGYFKYALFHVSNALRFHITGKSSKEYHPVR